MRVLSAVVLLIVIFGTLWLLPPWATVVLTAAAAWLAAHELCRIAAHVGIAASSLLAGASAALVSVAFAVSAEAVVIVLLAASLAAGAVTLASGPPGPALIGRAAVLGMAPLYVGLPLGVIGWVSWVHGPAATTWLLLMVAVSDSAQYYSGRAFGRHKLAPTVSPSKTIEGAVGGVVIATAVGALTAPSVVSGLTIAGAVGLTLAIVLAGIIGDLFESLLKRSAGVKDSSQLIPGHGGILDRIDSHLFAAPVFYLVLRFLS